jgi:hypothetical protein
MGFQSRIFHVFKAFEQFSPILRDMPAALWGTKRATWHSSESYSANDE